MCRLQVNTVAWADGGRSTLLVSGGDDRRLVVSDALTGRVYHTINTNHRGNIFSAKFLPASNNEKVLAPCTGHSCRSCRAPVAALSNMMI
jgi:WD40 repeat protein